MNALTHLLVMKTLTAPTQLGALNAFAKLVIHSLGISAKVSLDLLVEYIFSLHNSQLKTLIFKNTKTRSMHCTIMRKLVITKFCGFDVLQARVSMFNRFACFLLKGYQRGSLERSYQNGDYLKTSNAKKLSPAGFELAFVFK